VYETSLNEGHWFSDLWLRSNRARGIPQSNLECWFRNGRPRAKAARWRRSGRGAAGELTGASLLGALEHSGVGFLARIDVGNTRILTWGKTQWRTASNRLAVAASFPPSLATATSGFEDSPTKA
jgi:hypothetical protein